MENILVLTDFSRHSEYALEAAAAIARSNNCNILVMHMVKINDGILTSVESEIALESIYNLKLAEKRFKSLLNKEYLKGLKVEQVVKKHINFSEIDEITKDHKIDLIIMSSHGASGIKEILIGSNTEKVIRYSEIPVLIIKNRIGNFKLKTGVYASNFDLESIGAYKKIISLFDRFNINMKMLYVNTPGLNFKSNSEIDELLFKFFEKSGVENPLSKIKDVAIFSDYSVEDGIFAYSSLTNAELIAVPTHGRKGISHLMTGSISEDVANHANLPIITVKI